MMTAAEALACAIALANCDGSAPPHEFSQQMTTLCLRHLKLMGYAVVPIQPDDAAIKRVAQALAASRE